MRTERLISILLVIAGFI